MNYFKYYILWTFGLTWHCEILGLGNVFECLLMKIDEKCFLISYKEICVVVWQVNMVAEINFTIKPWWKCKPAAKQPRKYLTLHQRTESIHVTEGMYVCSLKQLSVAIYDSGKAQAPVNIVVFAKRPENILHHVVICSPQMQRTSGARQVCQLLCFVM